MPQRVPDHDERGGAPLPTLLQDVLTQNLPPAVTQADIVRLTTAIEALTAEVERLRLAIAAPAAPWWRRGRD